MATYIWFLMLHYQELWLLLLLLRSLFRKMMECMLRMPWWIYHIASLSFIIKWVLASLRQGFNEMTKISFPWLAADSLNLYLELFRRISSIHPSVRPSYRSWNFDKSASETWNHISLNNLKICMRTCQQKKA